MEKELYKIEVSNLKHKKYSVYVLKDKKKRKIHFGDKNYQHYQDTTPLQHYKKLNHFDNVRRSRYLKRAKGIKNKNGITWKDKNTSNYYSVKFLWGG